MVSCLTLLRWTVAPGGEGSTGRETLQMSSTWEHALQMGKKRKGSEVPVRRGVWNATEREAGGTVFVKQLCIAGLVISQP